MIRTFWLVRMVHLLAQRDQLRLELVDARLLRLIELNRPFSPASATPDGSIDETSDCSAIEPEEAVEVFSDWTNVFDRGSFLFGNSIR